MKYQVFVTSYPLLKRVLRRRLGAHFDIYSIAYVRRTSKIQEGGYQRHKARIDSVAQTSMGKTEERFV